MAPPAVVTGSRCFITGQWSLGCVCEYLLKILCFFFRGKRKQLQTSWPPPCRSRAVRPTCRMWLHVTSQTSAPWSSRRSSNCRVSQNYSSLNSQVQSISAEPLSHRGHRGLSFLPDSSFLSSNDLTHSLSSYLKQGEPCSHLVGCLRPSQVWLGSPFSSLSLSEVGEDTKAAHRKGLSGCPDRVWLRSSSHRAYQVSADPVMFGCRWFKEGLKRFVSFCRQLTAFKGEAKVVKLFAKHIKVAAWS